MDELNLYFFPSELGHIIHATSVWAGFSLRFGSQVVPFCRSGTGKGHGKGNVERNSFFHLKGQHMRIFVRLKYVCTSKHPRSEHECPIFTFFFPIFAFFLRVFEIMAECGTPCLGG